MRRTKTKKLELRRQKIARIDQVQELRQLKEDELKQVAGGMMEEHTCTGCCC